MKSIIFALTLLIGVSMDWTQTATTENSKGDQGLIKVSILYPTGEGKTFDLEYYRNEHMPMVARLLGDSLKKLSIDEGIAGGTPEDSMPFFAMGHLYFEALSAYQESFGPNAEAIIGDIPNYTNVQPVVQISRIVD